MEASQNVEKQTRAKHKGDLTPGGVPDDQPTDFSLDHSLKQLLNLGASPQALPDDIAQGDETILNSTKVQHAAFFNRLIEEIYGPWRRNILQYVDELQFRGGELPDGLYVTELAISMDDDGRIVSIETVKSSGVSRLDDASKDVFWEKEPFRNPPKQLKDKEGRVRFVYSFQLDVGNSFFRIAPWAI